MSQSIYKNSTENILTSGLHQMTIACETITKQNEILNKDIQNLKNKLTQAKEKLLVNNIEY
tara:strand:- start:18275 stop:18457 length:183 start_codon:yes stop_codon:yes gene_type:complete